MSMTQNCVGVDIAKDWIDAHDPATGKTHRIRTDTAALARFARHRSGALVVFEASGGFERPLMDALEAAGTPYARVNPRQAREFARATGRLAKTDRVDAHMLAQMGMALALAPDELAQVLSERAAELSGTQKMVRGWRVRTHFKTVSEEEARFKREGIAKILVQSVRRKAL